MKTWLLIIGICAGMAQSAFAQEKYLQIRRDYIDPNRKIKFFKGEIYRCDRPNQQSSWRVSYGNLEIVLPYIDGDRIYDYPLEKTRVEAIQAKEESLRDKKNGVIKKQIFFEQTRYVFNVKAIKRPGETAIFASNQNQSLTFEKEETEIIRNFDEKFPDEYIRVIVPDAPTMFIEKAGIQEEYGFDANKFVALKGKDGATYLKQDDGKIFLTNDNYTSRQDLTSQKIVLADGQILVVDKRGLGVITGAEVSHPFWDALINTSIFVIIVVVIGFLIIFRFKRKLRDAGQQGESQAVRKSRPSHWWQIGPLSFLKTRLLTKKAEDPQRQDAVKHEAAGKSVSTGATVLDQRFNVLEAGLQSVIKEVKGLGKQLTENKNVEMQIENERLRSEADNYRQKWSAASQEKIAIQQELNKKDGELTGMKWQLDEKENKLKQYSRAAEAIAELEQYVYRLPRAETWVQPHLTFFASLQGLENKFQSLLLRSQQESPTDPEADHLKLMWWKYAAKKNGIPVSRWDELLKGLKEKGVLTDRDLIRRIKDEKNDEQRWRVLNEQLFREVYLRWLSAILVLMEEARNLEHFIGAPTGIAEEAKSLGRDIRPLSMQAQQLFEITVYYAPLFDNYKQHANIRAVDEPVDIYFRKLRLQHDCIQQIVSYGMKSPFSNEQTTVILA